MNAKQALKQKSKYYILYDGANQFGALKLGHNTLEKIYKDIEHYSVLIGNGKLELGLNNFCTGAQFSKQTVINLNSKHTTFAIVFGQDDENAILAALNYLDDNFKDNLERYKEYFKSHSKKVD